MRGGASSFESKGSMRRRVKAGAAGSTIELEGVGGSIAPRSRAPSSMQPMHPAALDIPEGGVGGFRNMTYIYNIIYIYVYSIYVVYIYIYIHINSLSLSIYIYNIHITYICIWYVYMYIACVV